ncbi:MAG: DUF4861 family protein [Deltaproteobacteria bacterium]|nr:DUF4861 family protein [Deltaproteobacteria bacterium]
MSLILCLTIFGCAVAQKAHAMLNGGQAKKIIVTNPTQSFRDSETVSLNFKDVKKAVAGLTKDNVAVLEFKTNRLLVTQVVGEGSSSELLFQADFAPGEKKYFRVMKQPAGMKKPKSKAAAYCRFVPERKDDFAWENDKTAFRMYGPALEDETITCGIDAWSKCVPTPFIDKAYKSGNYKVKTVLINPHYCPDNKGENPGYGLLTQASTITKITVKAAIFIKSVIHLGVAGRLRWWMEKSVCRIIRWMEKSVCRIIILRNGRFWKMDRYVRFLS